MNWTMYSGTTSFFSACVVVRYRSGEKDCMYLCLCECKQVYYIYSNVWSKIF